MQQVSDRAACRTLSSLQAATAGQWIGRQDRRGELQPFARHRPDPGLNLPLGQMAVPDQPLAAGANGLHRLYDQLPRPRGPSGTGRTHIALGLGLAACQKGLSVSFTTAAARVNDLIKARDERRQLRL